MFKGGKPRDLRGAGQGEGTLFFGRCCTNTVNSLLGREKSQVCRRLRVMVTPAMDTLCPPRGHGVTPNSPSSITLGPRALWDPPIQQGWPSRCPRVSFGSRELGGSKDMGQGVRAHSHFSWQS